MISQEIKGQLAKLLATENLIVEHKRVSTASFDVNKRVLVLPVWDRAKPVVYDLLVGHEVGHALFTPNEDWTKRTKAPKDYINVVEDARIEKMMKRKYPGLAKTFYKGYQVLHDEDFFSVKDVDFEDVKFIDRINLHFKVGAYDRIPFAPEEQEYVDMIDKIETFDDVVKVCDLIWDFIKEDPKEMETERNSVSQSGQQSTSPEASASSASSPSGDWDDEDGEESYEDENESSDAEKPEGQSNKTSGGDMGSSDTQSAFDEAMEELTDIHRYGRDMVYLEIPNVYEENIIVETEDIHNYIEGFWEDKETGETAFSFADDMYTKFKKEAQKEVNYLVKEFECRKSADAYARAGQSKTGVLDTSKLHTYKFNDDIFKKVTVLPDGKNHGMIFVLDWSGSMGNVMTDTIKQLYNLMWFCRKVQIPFEVYAFTYSWTNRLINPEWDEDENIKYDRESNMLNIHDNFHLFKFFSSDTNNKTFEQQCKNIWRITTAFSYYVGTYQVPPGLDLSGTPLNETIICLKKIIPNFIKKFSIQKANVCILTDGESNSIYHDVEINRNGHHYIGKNVVDQGKCLRDRKLGRVYKEFENDFATWVTNVLIQNLKDNFPNVNLIGFRICTTGEFTRLHRCIHNTMWNDDAHLKVWRKQKSWTFQYSGWDAFYAISSNGLSSDQNNLDVAEDATKAQITKAFKTMLKSKTVNKKILNSFATLVS